LDFTNAFGTDLQRGKGMNDTHPEVAAQFGELMKAKSNEERLLMGCSMYDTAKQIVRSAIDNGHPGITDAEIKKKLFLRFYGHDFSQADREKFLSTLATE
jgi:hypothetical protein